MLISLFTTDFLRWNERSKEHLCYSFCLSKFNLKTVPDSGESLRERKISPSARPQGGASRMHWHVTTWEMYKNLRTKQEEEPEAISARQVIGFPPGFLLFPPILYKPWPLKFFWSCQLLLTENSLALASLGSEVRWHGLPPALSFPTTNFTLRLLSLTSFLKKRTTSTTFLAFQTDLHLIPLPQKSNCFIK